MNVITPVDLEKSGAPSRIYKVIRALGSPAYLPHAFIEGSPFES